MVYKCCIAACSTGKTKTNVDGDEYEGNIGVFPFPDEENDLERRKQSIRFVSRKDFTVTKYTRLCEKHFEHRFVRKGKRHTLIHDMRPIPTVCNYLADVPPSLKRSLHWRLSPAISRGKRSRPFSVRHLLRQEQ